MFGSIIKVKDLSNVDADIKCFRNAAVLSPSDVRSFFSNIYVSGVTSSKEAGTMLGSEAAAKIIDCRHDVLADGDDLDGDYVVRPAGIENNYHNMQWNVEVDGMLVYEGDDSERLSIDKVLESIAINNTLPRGKYIVSLNAFVDGVYIPISNDLEIEIYKYAE